MMDYLVNPGGVLQGDISVPGDKSISHRSVIFGAIADGVTQVSGLLEGMDVLATIHAFREMGVYIDGPINGRLTIHGTGLYGLQAPKQVLDMGNSGTAMRLLSGLLAAQAFDSKLTGDHSLNSRPMMRVVKPLTAMGASLSASDTGTPPLIISGGCQIKGHEFVLNIASAQVKSAILLAGLYADSSVTVTEPAITRDHTERMLVGMGCKLKRDGLSVTLTPPKSLNALSIKVPGDISSSAFYIVAASIATGSSICLKNVGINPTRSGVIDILKLMGADIQLHNQHQVAGESVADIAVNSASLQGIDIPQQLVALAIDEFPVIAIAAACAKGETRVTGAQELRVKESDRIAATVQGLQAIGVKAQELPDGMVIQGGSITGGQVDSHDDHRIAMSFAMAGLVSENPIMIKNVSNVATSFPGFDQLSCTAGLKIEVKHGNG